MDEPTARELMRPHRAAPILVTQGDEDLLIPGDRGAAFAEADRRRARRVRGRRPPPATPATRCRSTCCCATSPSAPGSARRAPPALAPRDPPPASARCYVSSPIGLGHAWRDVAIARELRALAARARDRLARAGAGHARARALRRAHPPREPPARARVAPHRRRGARARAERLPGLAADGRDPARQLHALPRRRAREDPYDLWIGDEAWELDYYLHENPELKTRRLLLPHRLRRLAADGRGRRRARRG